MHSLSVFNAKREISFIQVAICCIYCINSNEIPNHFNWFFFAANGVIYYVTIAMLLLTCGDIMFSCKSSLGISLVNIRWYYNSFSCMCFIGTCTHNVKLWYKNNLFYNILQNELKNNVELFTTLGSNLLTTSFVTRQVWSGW